MCASLLDELVDPVVEVEDPLRDLEPLLPRQLTTASQHRDAVERPPREVPRAIDRRPNETCDRLHGKVLRELADEVAAPAVHELIDESVRQSAYLVLT